MTDLIPQIIYCNFITGELNSVEMFVHASGGVSKEWKFANISF